MYIPVPGNPGIKKYRDTLITDEVAIYVNDSVRGELLSRDVGYELFIPKVVTQTQKIEKKVPVPIPFPVPRNGLYLGGGIGASRDASLFHINLDYLNKTNLIYGVQVTNFSGQNFLGFRVGIKL